MTSFLQVFHTKSNCQVSLMLLFGILFVVSVLYRFQTPLVSVSMAEKFRVINLPIGATTPQRGLPITTGSNYYSSLIITSNDSAQTCDTPQLSPFTPEVEDYLEKQEPKLKSCQKYYPLLFNSTLDGYILPAKTMDYFRSAKITECWYTPVVSGSSKFVPKMSRESFPLSLTEKTKIPPEHESIGISCKSNTINKEIKRNRLLDMHSFIHPKPGMDSNSNPEVKPSVQKLNVVIFGLDATSRMNFLRMAPKSYEYLVEELGAVDMAGYNKIGDNTYPNLMPFLASMYNTELQSSCVTNGTYDNCPFIWKAFKEEGYMTSYAEDAIYISIFNNGQRNMGFETQPTDYYLIPFIRIASDRIRRQNLGTASICYGPRLTFQVLLDNMKKFVYQMRLARKPYFHFTWSTGLTHDCLSALGLGDEHLLEALKWMEEETNRFNDTAFILMSDHGSRVGAFRNTQQGKQEDRLPFFFMVLPQWLRSGSGLYSRAYQNLIQNRKRLITTFDLHATLMDFLHLENLESSSILRRTSELLEQEKNLSLPLNISLFLPVPKSRTCGLAGIEWTFCSCLRLKDIPVDDKRAWKAAATAVKQINRRIINEFKECAQLKLNSVKVAQSGVDFWGKDNTQVEVFQVTFETSPGGALFEALVSKDPWKVTGTISRTNLYGNQSRCVKEHKIVKEYCYCI